MDERLGIFVTDTEGGDFTHNGKSPDGQRCERGKIVRVIKDNGQIIYKCLHCGRSWQK